MGFADPGLDFCEAVTDGKGEAMLLKAKYSARRADRGK